MLLAARQIDLDTYVVVGYPRLLCLSILLKLDDTFVGEQVYVLVDLAQTSVDLFREVTDAVRRVGHHRFYQLHSAPGHETPEFVGVGESDDIVGFVIRRQLLTEPFDELVDCLVSDYQRSFSFCHLSFTCSMNSLSSSFTSSGPSGGFSIGILVVKMAEFCLITPPIGLNCFVVAGVRDDLNVQDVFKGVMPFFIADAVTIGLLVAFPAIVLWLPGQV